MADVTTDGGTPASWQQTSDYTPGSAPTDERATIAYRGSQETAQAPRRRREWPKVPGYELLEVLGQGAMGVVYKARHEGLKRLVALKMILSGAHAGETELARFRTEAEAVARLTHPHIVQVHDFGEWRPESGGSPLPYLALEYVSGGTLSKYLKGTPQSPRFAAELLRHLAEAIQYAHEHNVIHRDLKPGNILLEGTSHESVSGGTVSQATPLHGGTMKGPAMQAREQLFLIPKIADFGLAKQLDEQSFQTMSGAIMGTPSYMAPEQASGHASQIGPSADVYALGSILYEVLTGRPPFKGVSMFETIEQVRNQEPVPPSRLQPRIPADLETICLKCLQKQTGAWLALVPAKSVPRGAHHGHRTGDGGGLGGLHALRLPGDAGRGGCKGTDQDRSGTNQGRRSTDQDCQGAREDSQGENEAS
jgi:serine/threonine protein kinase